MARRDARGVLGVFTGLDECLGAVRALVAGGGKNIQVFSPISSPEIQEALGKKASPLGYATLVAAVTGTTSGFAFCAVTAYKYSLITAGEPLSAWIPWAVVGFELTILFGCVVNFAAMVLMGGLARFRRPPGYDERFSVDRFGVFVPYREGADFHRAREILARQGAEEVIDRIDPKGA